MSSEIILSFAINTFQVILFCPISPLMKYLCMFVLLKEKNVPPSLTAVFLLVYKHSIESPQIFPKLREFTIAREWQAHRDLVFSIAHLSSTLLFPPLPPRYTATNRHHWYGNISKITGSIFYNSTAFVTLSLYHITYTPLSQLYIRLVVLFFY